MSRFNYCAVDENNKIFKSTIIEDDIDIASEKLALMNRKIIRINKVFSLEDLVIVRRLKTGELASFCGQIGIIVDSGVTILKGLDILVEQSDIKSYKKVLETMQAGVRRGLTLSESMRNTDVFPDLLVDMISSGELSGNLPEILFNMEEFYSREAQLKAKIKSASVYPMILFGAAVMMVVFFNLFVFSELKVLFEDVNDLPVITAMLLGSMDYINQHPLSLLAMIVTAVLTILGIYRIEKVRLLVDRMLIKLPIFGRVKMDVIISRLTSSMAILTKSAIPLVKVMGVLEMLANNRYVSKRIRRAKEEIVRGQNIADAFEECAVFDSMMIQMIRVGEETGKLEEMLLRLSNIYEKRCNVGISRLVSLIEPAFTLIVGAAVGFVIVAMAMPIFQMSGMYK